MSRPRFALRGDPENLRELVALQETRFLTLMCFCDELEKPELHKAVKEDDMGFKRLMRVCFEEFGVSKAFLARQLGISAAAVGRWANLEVRHLPPSYQRPTIVLEVAKVMREHIEEQYAAQRENDIAGVPTVLLGSIVC